MSPPDIEALLALDLSDEKNRAALGNALAALGRDVEAGYCRAARIPIRVVRGRVVEALPAYPNAGPPVPVAEQSRTLGVFSLLLGAGPLLGFACIASAIGRGDLGMLPLIAILFGAPLVGLAFGVAGVCWKERSSAAAVVGLLLNLLWIGLVLAVMCGGRFRVPNQQNRDVPPPAGLPW